MAGQNADMTLKVGLDLNFFKQELLKATSSLAGQPIDINVRFNKKSVADQYRLLSRYLGGKKSFDVKIESNTLNVLTDKVANFQKTLKALKDEKIKLSINASANVEKFSKEKVRKIRAQIYRDIVSGGAGEIQLPTKLATPKTAAFIKELSRQAQVTIGIKNGATGKEARSVLDAIQARIQSDQKIKQGGGKLRIPTSIKASINNADVSEFKKVVNEKLGNIAIKIKAEVDIAKTPSQIQAEVARKMEDIARIGAERMAGGGVTETARREQFRTAITGEGIGSLKNIASQVGVKGAYKYKSDTAAALIDKLVQEASIEAITKYLDPQAMMRNPDRSGLNKVLDTFARGLFQMLGMDPATIRREMAQQRALPGVNFPATIPQRNIPIGPSGTGRALPAGASAAGLIGGARPPAGLLPAMSVQSQIKAAVDALIAQQGPRALPSGGGQLVDTKRIYAALRKNLDEILQRQFTVIDTEVRETSSGIKDAMGAFAYLVQALKDAEARTKDARIDDAVSSLMREIEGAIKLAQSRARIIPAQVADLGTSQRMLQGQHIAGLLPAGVGRAPSPYATGAIGGETRVEMMARREREARMRSDLRGIDVMGGGAGRAPAPYSQTYRSARSLSAIVPYAAGGAIVPQPSMTGGGAIPPSGGGGRFGGTGGMGGFGRAMGGFGNLPGAGTIKELGSEFAFATKQVLLFGQAYKLLAFIQDFPSQVANAVSQLQNFRNTLDAITPSAQEFSTSNKYILSLVDQYNIPLQSARDGFTKLYASMKPAGFSGQEIRGIFEGISMGAATFGMSADKVDRVMYAFAQMASKGQVMSEELKSQLGDVLPGALALFAKAAKMSVQDFSQAMEDGAFKGDAMKQLLVNVGATMKDEFGKGAVGAASTFQGVMNRLQTTVQLFYETFEPAAILFANKFILPITNGVRIVTDAFNSLISKQEAVTEGGSQLAASMQSIIPSLQGIWQNMQMAGQAIKGVANALAPVLKGFLQILSLPIVGVFAQVYTTILLLNGAFTLLGGRILAGLIVSLVQTIGRMTALNMATIATNSTLAGTQLQLRLLSSGLAATGGAVTAFASVVRTAMLTTVVGAIATAVTFAVSEFVRLRGVMDDIAGRYKNIGDQARLMGESGNVAGIDRLNKSLLEQANTYEKIAKAMSKADINPESRPYESARIDKATTEAMKRAGLGGYVQTGPAGNYVIPEDISKVMDAINKNRDERRKMQAILAGQRSKAQQEQNRLDAQLKPGPIDLSAGQDTDKSKRERQLRDFQSEAIEQLKVNERIAQAKLEQQRQLEIIDETEYEIASASNKRKFELLVIDQALADKKAGIGDYEASIRAKQLAVFEQLAENERQLVEEEYQTSIKGAKLKLARPFKEGIRDENIEIKKQMVLLGNLRNGYDGLTVEQEANFIIEDKIRELKTKQQKLIETEIENLKEVTLERIKAARALQIEQTIKGLRDQLSLLRAISEEEQKRLRIAQENKDATAEQLNLIYDLEKVRDNIKAVRETIDSFVTDTSSDYKGFLKEVISGEDAVESLKKFQEALKDRTLTIFLDFAMAPVEKFFKEGLSKFAIEKFFPKGAIENMPEGTKPSTTPIEAQDKNTAETKLNTEAIKANTAAMTGAGGAATGAGPYASQSGGMFSLDYASGNALQMPELGSLTESANAYAEQLGQVDASVWNSAMTVGAAGEEMGPNGAAGKTWQQSLAGVVGGIGMAAGSIMGIMAGINQIKEGGTSNVLGGIGMIASMAGSLLGGFSGMFGGGSVGQFGTSSSFNGTADALGAAPFAPKLGAVFANGGIARGGFRAFANGGVVGGPTLGLMGEGKYNEAVVPLPDGRSIPVQLGGRSARDLMGNGAPGMPQAPSLSMKFETTKINGVEYVSREQLEQAMAETRRASIAGGAQRGMSMTLDKIKQSPSTRSSIGIR